jgi:hypothetical protein
VQFDIKEMSQKICKESEEEVNLLYSGDLVVIGEQNMAIATMLHIGLMQRDSLTKICYAFIGTVGKLKLF